VPQAATTFIFRDTEIGAHGANLSPPDEVKIEESGHFAACVHFW
jgi:hypothetical protein